MTDGTYGPQGPPPPGRPSFADEPPASGAQRPKVASPVPPAVPAVAPADDAAARRRRRVVIWSLVAGVLVLSLFGCCGLAVWAIAQSDDGPAIGPSVAVIYIDAEIAGVGDGLGASTITPENVISKLHKAEKDSQVKAIILRIDSPGGTASASQEIAMEVARAKKPVIVSVGDVCASGAYMIASQADLIMATPSSDVGSIGVIIMIGDYSQALEKLGIRYVTITEGKYKDAGSPFRALTDEERALLKKDMGLVYQQFIGTVSTGRKMKREKVEKLATGWAWPGARAKELGLVDKLGNYSDAIDEAARLGKIDGEPRIEEYGEDSIEQLIDDLAATSEALKSLSDPTGALRQTRPSAR